jgi:hypothetical protein
VLLSEVPQGPAGQDFSMCKYTIKNKLNASLQIGLLSRPRKALARWAARDIALMLRKEADFYKKYKRQYSENEVAAILNHEAEAIESWFKIKKE